MIVEKHQISKEATEDVYDFYESKDIELLDGSTGQVKSKIGTYKLSQLNDQKDSLNKQVADIDEKIKQIGLI